MNRSASAWHGCSKSDRELTTETEEADAKSSSRSCSNVRSTIASTYRLSTRPVSSMVSPRPSWRSVDEITSGWAPSSATPTSNDTLVRVDGFSKTNATERPRSRSAYASGSAFTLPDSSSSPMSSAGDRSSTER